MVACNCDYNQLLSWYVLLRMGLQSITSHTDTLLKLLSWSIKKTQNLKSHLGLLGNLLSNLCYNLLILF